MTQFDSIPPPRSNASKQLLGLLLLGGMCGILYYYWQHSNHQENQVTIEPKPEVSLEKPAEVIQYPIPTQSSQAGTANIPSLEVSDSTLEAELSNLVGKSKFSSLFYLDNIIRRIVVTIDNATHPTQLSWEMLPFKPMDSFFIVAVRGNDTLIASENARRYDPFIEIARTVNPKALVSIYVRFYPLFQGAYQDLGTRKYFNDRLVEVIDHLLEVPEIKELIPVMRPTKKNSYKFVDTKLENLSAGQKALLRMGYDNVIAIKSKMRQIRSLLVHLEGLDR